ncbi:MAG: KamA family radical SAM protein [Candidatus Omnitrophota bacterium]|nr:MAG: KamA family radical SAM protein [Candidatus Omnitrophota bacterium]
MEKWQEIISKSITDSNALSKIFKIDKKKIDKVIGKYPMKINLYYLGLIKKRNDPIWRQCVPDEQEIRLGIGKKDPLLEEKYSPIKGLIHRYRNRVLLLTSNVCAGNCRFCTRKRKVGIEYAALQERDRIRAFRYVKKHRGIRDVIISGGDPLLLSDEKIEYYLENLRRIKHVQIIRIDSRTLCTLPQRITPNLCWIFKKYGPIYFNTHFNHVQEITKESRRAASLLADSGVVIGNQAVLLRGINDDVDALKQLFEGLLSMRIRPYYLYIPDAVQGTYHFRVSIAKALKFMRGLIGYTSGLAIPHLIVDLKHGGGKTPVLPKYIVRHEGRRYVFRNFEGKKFYYADIY